MSTHNIPFLNIKKSSLIIPNPQLFVLTSEGPKNEFETAVVNEQSVFGPLEFYL